MKVTSKSRPIESLPNGSLVAYKNHIYFISKGLEDRIVTSERGRWTFIRELEWKSYNILYTPTARMTV